MKSVQHVKKLQNSQQGGFIQNTLILNWEWHLTDSSALTDIDLLLRVNSLCPHISLEISVSTAVMDESVLSCFPQKASPWFSYRRQLRAEWIRSPDSGTGFWRRSRERLWAGGISCTGGSRDGPSPLSCVEYDSVKADRWWKLLRAGWLDPGPLEWKLH